MAITEFPIFTKKFEDLEPITDAQSTDSDGVMLYDDSVGVMKRMTKGELFKGKVIPIDDITGFLGIDYLQVSDRQQYHLNSFAPGGESGGGSLMWSSTLPKILHDGVRYFSPTVPMPDDFDNDQDVQDYKDGVGEEFPADLGIFVLTSFSIQSSEFPAVDNAIVLFDGVSGNSVKNGPKPTEVGVNLIEFPDSEFDGYFRKKNDNTLELLTGGQLKTNLSLNNVDNTSDSQKVSSGPIFDALELKADVTEVDDALALKADLESPSFTGNPTAPTPAADDDSESIATTEYVQDELSDRVQSVATIADLRSLAGVSAGKRFSVTEYSSGLGWGGGDFIAKSGTAGGDNIVVKFDSSGTAGIYFERIILDGVVNADMAGIAADPSSDDKDRYLAALAAAEGRGFLLDRHIWISPIGLAVFGVPNNCTVSFGGGGIVELLPHNTSDYTILPIHNVENVTVINPRVDGRKDLNSAIGGEFGMGISVRATRGKVRIVNPVTNNCWGDGLFVAGLAVQEWVEDVEIVGHKADGCRRQGLSLVSAKRFILDGAEYTNISGTSPAAGIDIEPDRNTDELGYIRIRNVRTKNCQGPGIKLYLGSLSGAIDKFIDIQIDGHTDDGSLTGLAVEVIDTAKGNMTGKIVVVDSVYSNSKNQGCVFEETSATGPEISVIRPTIINSNRASNLATKYGAPISIFRDTVSPRTYTIGNVTIINHTIINTLGLIPNNGLVFVDDTVTPANVANVRIMDPLRISTSVERGALSNNSHIYTDRYEKQVNVVTANTVLDRNHAPHVKYQAPTTGILTLPAGVPNGYPSITIENTDAGRVQVATPAGGNFVGHAVGQAYSSGTFRGNKIRMVPLGSGIWRAEPLGGSWSIV